MFGHGIDNVLYGLGGNDWPSAMGRGTNYLDGGPGTDRCDTTGQAVNCETTSD